MKPVQIFYLVVAAGALIWTQWLLVDFLLDGGTLESTWDALSANAVTQFVAIDLVAVFLAAIVFMVVEGRRLELRRWWLYPLLSATIAVSVALPLFLYARSRRMEP